MARLPSSERTRRWRAKNIDIARAKTAEYMRLYYARRRAEGVCLDCGGGVTEGFVTCQACRDRKASNKVRRVTGSRVDASARHGNCEVCNKPASQSKGGVLDFDHCHVTGKFRGWLCHVCNTVLGQMRDDPGLIYALAAYAARHHITIAAPLPLAKES